MAENLVDVGEVLSGHRARRKTTAATGVGVVAVLGAAILIALSLGSTHIPVIDIAKTLVAGFDPFSESPPAERLDIIIWRLRLPRILMALVSGAGLSIAGAVMQGVLRNPLVSPFTVGVSGGAVLGASVAIIFGASMVGFGRVMVISNAFLFAVGTSAIIIAFGRLRGMTPESFILVGIALNSVFGALTSILQYIATEGELAQVVYWTFGTLQESSYERLLVVSVVLAVLFPILMLLTWHLNAMSAGGDEVAASLGVNCGLVRVSCMMISALITAGILSFTGIIGFVGLVAPHITRLLLGSDHRVLLPFSAAVGAMLLLVSDTVGRTLFAPVMIPVGIVISIIGAPFFFYLLLSRRKRRTWE
jgi:iron complex transport system permease protein